MTIYHSKRCDFWTDDKSEIGDPMVCPNCNSPLMTCDSLTEDDGSGSFMIDSDSVMKLPYLKQVAMIRKGKCSGVGKNFFFTELIDSDETYESFVSKMFKPLNLPFAKSEREQVHAIIGLVGELAEYMTTKTCCHGNTESSDLGPVFMESIEELGDIEFYYQAVAKMYGCDTDAILHEAAEYFYTKRKDEDRFGAFIEFANEHLDSSERPLDEASCDFPSIILAVSRDLLNVWKKSVIYGKGKVSPASIQSILSVVRVFLIAEYVFFGVNEIYIRGINRAKLFVRHGGSYSDAAALEKKDHESQ